MNDKTQLQPLATGPITETGKQTSSANSLRHGLTAQRVVLEDESHEDFLELLMSFFNDYQPQNRTEQSLVENMVIARWRQARLRAAEAAGLSLEMNYRRYDDTVAARTWAALRIITDSTRTLELLNRYDARFEREFRQNLNCLLQLRSRKRRKTGKCAPPKLKHLGWLDEPGTAEEKSSFGKMTIADLAEFNRKNQKSEE